MAKSNTRITADKAEAVGRKNLIINGGFDVWQRGTSSTAYSSSTRGYIADRWSFRYASLMERSTDVPADLGFKYSAKVTTVSANDPFIIQGIENVDKYAGMEVTFSYWIKPSAALTLRDDYLAGAHGTHVLVANVWQKITNTFTVPTGVQTNDFLYIQFPSSTVATYHITGVQLELGSVATDFEHRSYGEELALCQRYFYIHNGTYVQLHWVNPWGRYYGMGYFPVTMRISPSTAFGFTNVTNLQPGGTAAGTSMSMDVDARAFRMKAYSSHNGYDHVYIGNTNNGNFDVKFDAEL